MGFAYAAWRAEARLADALPRALEGHDVTLTGIVTGLPQEGEGRALLRTPPPARVAASESPTRTGTARVAARESSSF